MNTKFSSSARLNVSALLGIAVAGLLYATPASAQGMTYDEDPGLRMDPAPIEYPFAAPGGLDMFHWKNYQKKDLEPNSATWERSDRQEKMDRELRDRIKAEDLNDGSGVLFHRDFDSDDSLSPAPIAYPYAAPAGLHLYHWRTYEMKDMEPGSATDARYDRMHRMDLIAFDRMKDDDSMRDGSWRRGNWDPEPISYPFAAPGGLDLFHWRTYEKKDLEPGSATSTREDHMNKKMKAQDDGN